MKLQDKKNSLAHHTQSYKSTNNLKVGVDGFEPPTLCL